MRERAFGCSIFRIMSEEENNSNRQVISLQSISRQFLSALQRQYDLLAFNLAASQHVSEENYNTFSTMTRVMPVAPMHMPFEGMKTYVRGLILRQTLNDLLGIAAACMDSCHLLCTLIANKEAMDKDPKATNELVGRKQQAFVNSSVPDKFEAFEKEFGITNSLEDAVVALGIALGSLMRRNGVVTAEDVDDDGELAFEFKTVQTIQPLKPEDKPEVRLADTRRAFKVGDTIDLTNSELLSLNVTVADFFHKLFRAVDAFGEKTLGKGSTPHAEN